MFLCRLCSRKISYFRELKLVKINKNKVLRGFLNSKTTKDYALTAKMSQENGCCNRIFKFTDYDCIGFDLDNTICRYKISSMVKMEYNIMSNYLITEKGYPKEYLIKPIEEDLGFMLKGLILDVERGNVLRIASDGHVLHGSHGTRELTKEELIHYYGSECRWDVTDIFSNDPLHTWNGPHSEKMRTLLDYFDMPAGLVFARAVDSIDKLNGGPLEKYSVWPDLLDALNYMFKKEHFQLNIGEYFPNIKEQPENYIHKCSDLLIKWFKDLRLKNKILFLITGSNVDFATHTATNSLGPNWQKLFDIVICFAKKPGFFVNNRPFIGLDGFEETGPVHESQLKQGGIYNYGNWASLYNFLKAVSGKDNPKIVYVGDNLIQDVYAPAVHTQCDTVAICEELQAEGVFGYDQFHDDQHYLISPYWGSYFNHKDKKKPTIWLDIIKRHSKIVIPNLEYVACRNIDHKYVFEICEESKS